MKRIWQKIWRWFLASNRYKHFIGGLIIGAGASSDYCAVYAGSLTAAALEYKDKAHGCKWDWIDFGLTMAGVIIGRLIRLIIFKQ